MFGSAPLSSSSRTASISARKTAQSSGVSPPSNSFRLSPDAMAASWLRHPNAKRPPSTCSLHFFPFEVQHGCIPAEPASVSPGEVIVIVFEQSASIDLAVRRDMKPGKNPRLPEANRGSERRSMTRKNRPARGAHGPTLFGLLTKAEIMFATSEAPVD
jgi:hypothetical protein